MHKAFLFLLLSLLFVKTIFGQYYDSGQDPNSIKWKQICSERFQLIYPSSLDSLARIYFSNLDNISVQESKTLIFKPTQIPVVLHNQTIIANGEVAWAPKRMNLYLVAGQDNYFQPWEQNLPTHEYRHTAQLSKLNQGTTRFFTVLFGEQATAAILGWHIPMWFIEGDAVAFETGASNAGRGRVPDFGMKIKAQLVEKGIYSYPKAMFGSYKDFVPNRYELGYQLVTEGRKTYGFKLWNNALDMVARKPLCINPFSDGIKEVTGLSERKLYFETMQNMKKDAVGVDEMSDSKKISTLKADDYCNYFCPVQTANGILAYKTSLKNIPGFVLIDSTGNEQRKQTPGYVFDDTFSATDSIIVWNELKSTRWNNQNFSRIAKYDLINNKLRYLVNEGRVFHSRISLDNKTLLSVEVSEFIKWSITLRDAVSGDLIKSFPMDTLQPVQPEWSPDKSKAVFIGISQFGKSLGILNLADGTVDWILKNEQLEISNPKFTNNGIWVKGVYNNTSNYFFYSFKNHKWQLKTNVPFGVGEGSNSTGIFLYTSYTSSGLRIYQLGTVDTGIMGQVKPSVFSSNGLNRLAAEETQIKFPQKANNYESKDYKKFTHLFNFHSWAPLAIRVENQEVGWGVTAMSQNVLSTSFLNLGYQYHMAENYHEYFIDYQYKGFYPIIDNKYVLSPFSYYQFDKKSVQRLVTGIQQYLSQDWSVPFYFNRGAWTQLVQPEIGYTFSNYYYQPNEYIVLNDKFQHKFSYRLNGYNLIRKSYRDLYPRWGQTISLQFEQVPIGQNKGYIAASAGRFYFPGIWPNHSFRIYVGYQVKDEKDIPKQLRFHGKILYPRGYSAPQNDEMLSWQFDYTLPLAYPDLNLKELLYIKRMRLNLFYDLASYKDNNDTFYQDAVGADLGFDFHVFRFIAPVDVTFRYAYKITEQANYFNFMFRFNMNALYGGMKQEIRE